MNRYLIILIVIFQLFLTEKVNCQEKNSDSIKIQNLLKNENVNQLIIDYYNGILKPTDNEETVKLLEILTEKNNELFELNLLTLNKIMEESDGALSEILGVPCFEFIYNHPSESIEYFSSNREILINFAAFLGYEFYFIENNTSSLTLKLNEFHEFLINNTDSSNNKNKETIDFLISEINSVIEKMD